MAKASRPPTLINIIGARTSVLGMNEAHTTDRNDGDASYSLLSPIPGHEIVRKSGVTLAPFEVKRGLR